MSETWGSSRGYRESLISGISAGFFFVVLGALFITTPNLFQRVIDFVSDFEIVRIPNTGVIYWPAPASPFAAGHRVVYTAVEQFSYIWALFQIVILALRLVFRSPAEKGAETVGNIAFWFGNGVLVRTFLLETLRLPLVTGLTRWFLFWALLIILLGATLIIRALIVAAVPRRRRLA